MLEIGLRRKYMEAGFALLFIITISFLLFIGWYRRKTLKDKIAASDHQLAFNKKVLEIAFEFMTINQENADDKVEYLLERIGSFFHMDRTYLFEVDPENQTMAYSHEWCAEGIESQIGPVTKVPLAIFPWWINQLEKNNLVYVEDVNQMPDEAHAEQRELRRLGSHSLMAVPVRVEGEIMAFIGLVSVGTNKEWSQENVELLDTMSEIIANGIIKLDYNRKIDFMAYHDILTGLPNRCALTERVEQKINKNDHQEHPIGMLFIDIDGFRGINDALGHDEGDHLLKQVASRLLAVASKADTVCRLGGDEFVLYVNDYEKEEDLEYIATQVMEVFQKPFVLRDQNHPVTASIGISRYPEDGEDVETLIKHAEMAKEKAKELGENQYQKVSKALKNHALETIELTNALHQALEKGEMLLYYQPKVNGRTGEILGLEALLRWNRPGYGFISPADFIPLAEKTRQILPIGYWVLKTACQQCKDWQKKGFSQMKIAVNLSVYQINHPDIVQQVQSVLEETGLEGKYLELEITESATVNTNKQIEEVLKELKAMGITISIDDFGKEYSSLSRFKELSIDKIKIDMSFVQGIGINIKDEAIIKAVALLMTELKVDFVAEGVETKEQVDFLLKLGCYQFQGYYFYRPMPVKEFESVINMKN